MRNDEKIELCNLCVARTYLNSALTVVKTSKYKKNGLF
jgi:hypothetical protein